MTEFTPSLCHEAAQQAIGAYIQQVGAYGDAEKCRKALQMLVSTAALGYGSLCSQTATIDMMLRTSVHVAARMESGNAYPTETVQ